MDICAELKRYVRDLELKNETLKMEKLEVDKETLALHENINVLKETLLMKKEACSINLTELEKESLDLKGRSNPCWEKTKTCLRKLNKWNQTLLQTSSGTGPQEYLNG